MERPPGTISLETLGAPVAQQFVHAFSRPGSNGSRPDAKSWVTILEKLQVGLRVCTNARWHHYPGELQGCPWCVLESQTALRLFGQRIVVPGGTVDVAALWQAIVAIRGPGDDPALPSQIIKKLPSGIGPKRALKNIRQALSIIVVCSGFVACYAVTNQGVLWSLASYVLATILWPWVSAEERLAADRAYTAADSEWQAIMGHWQREASQVAFVTKLKDLESARNFLVDMANERRRRLAKLEADRERLQRERYLDRFRIDLAKITGIGPNRTSMLASFGIETANDIDAYKIKQIPGFGDHLTSMLIAWRKMHEMNFRFNPNEPVDRRDIEALDRELEAKRQQLQTALSRGPAELMRLSQEIITARTRLMPVLEKVWEIMKLADAQRKAL
jgi:DNA-binding helix-hairpin-helix protein with protein kinase domain